MNQENLSLLKMGNTLENSNRRKEINHLCLMTNEQVRDPNSSYDDDAGNTSEEEQEEVEEECEVADEVYDGLNKCSKSEVIKLLLYLVK